jgi:hypothetical protein
VPLLLVVFAYSEFRIPHSAFAQGSVRHATTIEALRAYPVFFHQKSLVVRGELKNEPDGRWFLQTGAGHRIQVLFTSAGSSGPRVDVRGELWDIGRMPRDDPRFSGVDLRTLLGPSIEERWPTPGDVLILRASSAEAAPHPPAPTVRSIALEPDRYADQRVTVTGRFRGRNLYGDLPNAPGRTRWDYVLHTADAAIWVTGLRPRGQGFNLDVDAKVDTGKWLEVAGVVKTGRGLVWVEATQAHLAKPVETPPETTGAKAEPQVGPPPHVVFSAPTQDETDVPLDTAVRIQFSRDMNPKSFAGQVRAYYSVEVSRQRGEPQPPIAKFTQSFDAASRTLTLRFAAPLERFRTLTIELGDGIRAFDGAPLTPWKLEFSLGGL